MSTIYKSREITAFFRDKQLKFAVEDAMTNKLDKSMYKIALKFIPLDKDNKAKKEEIMAHYMDVSEVKRLIHHVLNKQNLTGLYNASEKKQGNDVPCYKDMKGGQTSEGIKSRILTFVETNGEYFFQLSLHDGRKYGQGAVVPTSGPKKKLYIKLSGAELETLAIELRDYIQQKEVRQFHFYHYTDMMPVQDQERKNA
ncbi:hypothetical protein AWH56_008595 [Anaerobacillus isosaccharinicus]|uniref:Uncharacterized protein n=1 Tax=Anaerobacillus isosaccharinicus TaxID=1532552 RepID=A0A1S2L198_9BACI|nr:hypothetical protein [Anaerobacillus isosaccharinicus]MBA5583957.1 hypothetical protein [Anaerobacillus isosaccharinicus]QOY37623.1 hypothetical protein AWH56_008595 [Anaerobacillus isosaccharinicus]